ncbi:VOC family protein [Brevundimonas sp.]|jgi:catechol 2,3-dioxygenase-like lactoylglutathione lyase family enzyme|uniref:VOC family protein n=1 Tax=Brevundimonas sp. TaxID=1871086 RepID=UPI002E149458|nr:VOC family protein [Brevundimonas sp.]
MLRNIDAHPIVAVTDLARARLFYGKTLDLPEETADATMAVYRTGATRLTVYVSEYAGSNLANAVVWAMGKGLEDVVRALTGRGVTFEKYDFPGTTFEDGVHLAGDARMAWFKDPDGNILHLVQGM